METIMSSCDRAMEVLGRFGYSPAREARMSVAHGEACCYLCHAPYRQALDDCICPHWLVMPWASAERMAAVLHTCELPGIIHFLLGYVRAEHGSRHPYRAISAINAVAYAGGQEVLIKLKRRSWGFALHQDTASGASRLLFNMKTRSPKDFSCAIAPGDRDIEFFRTLVDQVDHTGPLWPGYEKIDLCRPASDTAHGCCDLTTADGSARAVRHDDSATKLAICSFA